METIFTRIINREVPSKIFYESDQVIVIEDIRPKAPVHLLIVPKEVTKNFYESSSDILNLLNDTVKQVAEKLEISDHFKVQINNGYGQEIDHIHYHFLSDRGRDRLKFITNPIKL